MQVTYLSIYLSYVIFTSAVPFDVMFERLYLEYGIYIWDVDDTRVGLFSVVEKVDKNEVGLFQNESKAYIILSFEEEKVSIFYWFGKDTTLSQRITTAEKVCQLLQEMKPYVNNPKNIQLTRWVSGLRNENFFQITGIKNVSERKLYKVKGKSKAVRIVPVEAHYSSLTTDDSFVLNLNNSVIVYTPAQSNSVEKKKAIQLGHYILNIKKLQRDQLILIDDNYYPLPDTTKFLLNLFFELLNWDQMLPLPISIDTDKQFSLNRVKNVRVRCSYYENNTWNLTEYMENPLFNKVYEYLQWHACFVIDTGNIHQYAFALIGPVARLEDIYIILKTLETDYSEFWEKRRIVLDTTIPNKYLPEDLVILFEDLESKKINSIRYT